MNSQIELDESAKLACKLVERTRERKLGWEIAEASLGFCGHQEPSDKPADLDRFATQLLGSVQQAVIGQRENGMLVFSLIEHDPRWSSQSVLGAIAGFDPPLVPDKVVLEVEIDKDPPYGYDTTQEQDLAALLIDLYGLARRSALKIDTSVEKALSYLDRIAG